jgi:uncharacterized damage-inducible protein DinB
MIEGSLEASPGDLQVPGAIPGGLGGGSIHEMLVHVVGAEDLWLRRWKGDGSAPMASGADFPDVEAVAVRWRYVENNRAAMLEQLTDQDLDREVVYVSVTRGVQERFPLWETMLHVANHSTHHRADVCTALTALGRPVQSVDLIDYLRER